VLAASTSMALAQPVRWTTYTIPETGTSVDSRLPSAAPNVANDSPAAFLAKKNPPPRIQYKRVTARFFAVSSYKGDMVWYDRCNFSRGLVHCVLINYPAREERDWDGIVTRISLSLSGK
jgi:hypothetical protein